MVENVFINASDVYVLPHYMSYELTAGNIQYNVHLDKIKGHLCLETRESLCKNPPILINRY